MDKFKKINNKLSIITSNYNYINRKILIISLKSIIGKQINNLWLYNRVEYGDIKHIISYPIIDSIDRKYHIICVKYDKKTNNYNYTSWCIQIYNNDLNYLFE